MSVFIRTVIYSGETPIKIIAGRPTDIVANLASGAYEARVVSHTVTSTVGLAARTSYPQDERVV